jgi:NADP-dependent 3-hydroxy acid dehydrogenase YdfG
MSSDHSRTVIVVGASSGVGRAVAARLARAARPVAIVARREDELAEVAKAINAGVGAQRVRAYTHDVRDRESIDRLFTKVEAELGEVDELHYLAGIMPAVALDEFPTELDAAMIETNCVGCMAWVNAAVRRFLPRRRGHVVGVTSVAAVRGRLDRPGYNASKAGQDAFLEAVRNRIWRHGVRVTTVRLGPVHTPMTEGLKVPMPITAEKAAQGILRARDRNRAISYVPFQWRPIMAVIRSIPSFVFRRLNV